MMSTETAGGKSPRELERLLFRLDLAQETLEGLDELQVTSRDELIALMDALEAEVGEEPEPAP